MAQSTHDDNSRAAAPDGPVDPMIWLIIGGTRRPPRSFERLLQMTRERGREAEASKAYDAARKEAKAASEAAFEQEWGKKPTNMRGWLDRHLQGQQQGQEQAGAMTEVAAAAAAEAAAEADSGGAGTNGEGQADKHTSTPP